MFYSQIILAKKGPLGRVWQAAHWGEKKISRPQIFNTDIAASVESIVHPTVPLALRVSGHLLLGVVRIYSRQVKYCLTDCHEAMVKIKMAFRKDKKSGGAGGAGGGTSNIDMVVVDPSKHDGNSANSLGVHSSNALNVTNFGEYQDFLLDPNAMIVDDDGDATGFAIPIDLNQMSDRELAERWVQAENSFNGDSQNTHELIARADSQQTTSQEGSSSLSGVGGWQGAFGTQTHTQPEEQWQPFDPTQEDLELPLPEDSSGDDEEEAEAEKEDSNSGKEVKKKEQGEKKASEEDELMLLAEDDLASRLPDDKGENHNNKNGLVLMDNDDEPNREGRVLEIELARADDSILSENHEVRMSVQDDMDEQGNKRNKLPNTPAGMMSEASFSISADDTSNLGQIPVSQGEDEEDAPMIHGAEEIAGLDFSRDSITGEVGGLDESAEIAAAPTPAQLTDEEESDASAPKPRKRKTREGPKRRRTRRKVVIDNDATELEGDHIKNMLLDTRDITLVHIPHPADWTVGRSGDAASQADDYCSMGEVTHEGSYYSASVAQTLASTMPTQETTVTSGCRMALPSGIAGAMGQEDHMILEHLHFEELLLRPSLGDDGQLHPELLQLWRDNLCKLEGKPSPYPKRLDLDGEEEGKEGEQQYSVEVARGGDDKEAEAGDKEKEAATMDADAKDAAPLAKDSIVQPQDDDSPMHLPEDEGEPILLPEDNENAAELPMGLDDEAPQLLFDREVRGKPNMSDAKNYVAGSQDEKVEPVNKYGLSDWGMVNDARLADEDGEDEDDPRQEVGTELVPSSSKWHKHTVRVLKVLQCSMGKGNNKHDPLIFGDLVKHVGRRTAAGVFFEVLQLKTWDFLDVEQGEAEGPIAISAGPRFLEDRPTNDDQQ